VEFKLEVDNTLNMLQNNQWIMVDIKKCFPVTAPLNYLSIKDEKKNEIVLLETLDDLDEVNREIVLKYLDCKSFIFEITGIYDIQEEFGVRHWEVLTKQGKKVFQTELDVWPEQLVDNSILIKDIFADKFIIKKLEFGDKILARYC